MSKGDIYWGFLDNHNQITVALYKSDRQIELTESQEFCRGIFEPFHAASLEEAKRKCAEKLKEGMN